MDSPMTPYDFGFSYEVEVPQSSDNGSYEISLFNPLTDSTFAKHLTPWSVITWHSVDVYVSPVYADYTVLVREVPANLSGVDLLTGRELFGNAYTVIWEFFNSITTLNAVTQPVPQAPHPMSRVLKGVATNFPSTAFLIGVIRNNRGGSTSNWKKTKFSIKFVFHGHGGGHGITL